VVIRLFFGTKNYELVKKEASNPPALKLNSTKELGILIGGVIVFVICIARTRYRSLAT
jgi:hypothetical protein